MCKFLVQQSQYTTVRPVILNTLVGHSHRYVISFCFVCVVGFAQDANKLHLQYQGRTLSAVPKRSIKSRQTLHVIMNTSRNDDNNLHIDVVHPNSFHKVDMINTCNSSPTPTVIVTAPMTPDRED